MSNKSYFGNPNRVINSFSELDNLVKDVAEYITENHYKPDSKKVSKRAFIIYLRGDLGTGKTTFCQHFIRYFGFTGKVTSPTYSLMNDYDYQLKEFNGKIIHCDLYRLADPEEIYDIGLLEYFSEISNIVLIEWASKGEGVLPDPELTIELSLDLNNRSASINSKY